MGSTEEGTTGGFHGSTLEGLAAEHEATDDTGAHLGLSLQTTPRALPSALYGHEGGGDVESLINSHKVLAGRQEQDGGPTRTERSAGYEAEKDEKMEEMARNLREENKAGLDNVNGQLMLIMTTLAGLTKAMENTGATWMEESAAKTDPVPIGNVRGKEKAKDRRVSGRSKERDEKRKSGAASSQAKREEVEQETEELQPVSVDRPTPASPGKGRKSGKGKGKGRKEAEKRASAWEQVVREAEGRRQINPDDS